MKINKAREITLKSKHYSNLKLIYIEFCKIPKCSCKAIRCESVILGYMQMINDCHHVDMKAKAGKFSYATPHSK